MKKLLINGDWFEPISSRSINESDYEQSIYRWSDSLFKGYWCLKFNAPVKSDLGVSCADMVLIDQEYRGWTVVEVELEHHSLAQHVEPQMRRLVNGTYETFHARAIHQMNRSLDWDRLNSLVCNVDPEFLVVVPKESVDWRATLGNLGVKLAVIEVFADGLGRRVVASSGDAPRSWSSGHLTPLRRDGFLPRAFRLEVPTAIPLETEISITYCGSITTWRVVVAKKTTYILPNGTFDLEAGRNYHICKTPHGSLAIEELAK